MTAEEQAEKLARPEPFVCPVCGGRGSMPNWFYSDSCSTAEPHPVACRTCNGRGIVWTPDPKARRMTREQAAVVEKFLSSCKQVPAIRRVDVYDEQDDSVLVMVIVDEWTLEVVKTIAGLELQAVKGNPLVHVHFEVREDAEGWR